jgi:ABC-2 type transport system permease protein
VDEARATVAVCARLVGARIRSEWQYRTSFVLFLLSQTLIAGLDFAAIAILFTNIETLGGWSVAQVAVLFGINGLAFGLGDICVSPVETVARHIKQGTFDGFLIRPVPVLTHLLASEFELRRMGRLLQPAAVLTIALPMVDIAWRPAAVAVLVSAVAAGAVIFGALWVLTSCIAFWTVETQQIGHSVTYGGKMLADYPVDVLGAWLRRTVIFVVPIAFVAYLPTAWLLDKPLPAGLPRSAGWAAPAVALVLALVARLAWNFALRHYRSTGS